MTDYTQDMKYSKMSLDMVLWMTFVVNRSGYQFHYSIYQFVAFVVYLA